MDAEEKEYARALERSMTSIESCCAEVMGSLEKLRHTSHRMVEKMMVLDDLNNSLDAISAMAKTMAELVPTVGRLVDRVEELEARGQR
jgi:phage shock protein A